MVLLGVVRFCGGESCHNGVNNEKGDSDDDIDDNIEAQTKLVSDNINDNTDDIDDSIEPDDGDMTTYSFDLNVFGLGNEPRLFFRVDERVDER